MEPRPKIILKNFTEISAHQQAPAQLTPPMGGVTLKFFYDGTTREMK